VQERDEAARREKVNIERSNRRFIKRNRAKQYSPGGGAIVWGEESYTDRWAFLYRNEREPVLLR